MTELAKPSGIVAAHAMTRRLTETVWYPEHGKRTATAEYRDVHHHLVYELDEACWTCGVRHSTLADPKANPHGAVEMETHHDELEWALANAADPAKILADFPTMGTADEPHLRQWLDSENNMLVLCNVHHRSGLYGIHMVTYPAWKPQRWLFTSYDLAKGPAS